MTLEGRWRIVEMELWDRDAVELLGACVRRHPRERPGSFGFIAVEGWMDIRRVERDGSPAIEFSWDGNDESNAASGRGWAALSSHNSLNGRIFFHMGDDSAFRAVRESQE